MTPQEIFDKVYLGLKAQGKKSMQMDGKTPRCRYHTDSGAKCAVGMLVSDEIAVHWDNNYMGIHSIVNSDVMGVEPWMVEHVELLGKLQRMHDGLPDWSYFEPWFTEFAYANNLKVPSDESVL